MKEKIKRFIGQVFSNKAASWMNAVFSVMFLVLAVYDGRPVDYYFAFAHALIPALFCLLYIKEKETDEWKDKYFRWRILAELTAERHKRYRKLYGELPAEEAESEKQNSENPSQAER